jgi:methylmalonyl-CoA mutase N-terminal domain/subunit
MKFLVLMLVSLVVAYGAYKRKQKFNDCKSRIIGLNKYNQARYKYK